jgi:hypothetical protein
METNMTRYTTIRDFSDDIYRTIIETDRLGIRDADTDTVEVAREVLERLDATLADVDRGEALELAERIIDGADEGGHTVSRDSLERKHAVEVGDYVLATKYSDGDPRDHFCVGFLSRIDGDRCIVVDGYGIVVRPNGFRRAERITREEGDKLVAMFLEIADRPGPSLWEHLRRMREIIDGEDDEGEDGHTVSIDEDVLSHYEIARLLEMLGLETCEDDADTSIAIDGRRVGRITGDTVGVIHWGVDPE